MNNIIIFIGSLEAAGAERVTCLLAGYWVSLGYSVTICTGTPFENDAYQLSENVKRKTLNFNYTVSKYLKPLEEIRRLWRMISIIKKTNNPVVIGSTTSLAIRVAIIKIILGRKIKAIGWEHCAHSLIKSKIKTVFRRKIYYYLDHLVLLTDRDKEGYPVLSNISVIPNPPSFSGSEKKDNSNKYKRSIISVGRLTSIKGFDRLIIIAKLVKKKYSDIVFNIYGEGEYKEELEKLIREENLSDTVFLRGYANDIILQYKSADIFVMTSYLEGFPMSMLEAMSFGLPVISLDCPTGPKEIIGDSEYGFLIDQKNFTDVANKIYHLIENGQIYDELSNLSIERAKYFSIENIHKKWQKLF